ncbi:hypothetical protein GGI43DRAFT_398824 [Trichoderma evansii]
MACMSSLSGLDKYDWKRLGDVISFPYVDVELGSHLFNKLTGGKATELKHIDATLGTVDRNLCELSAQLAWETN